MKLVPATHDHLRQIMEWFPDQHSCAIWGGPQFRFPFTELTFFEDARVDVLPSYALVENDTLIVGFGQYYFRVGRCHLGRLVISPERRGRHLGKALIYGLVELGVQELNVDECSLFVAEENIYAMRLYEKLGFVKAQYPEEDPGASVFAYMVAPASRLSA